MWPAFRLLAEDLVWCPEWYFTYWGFSPDYSPAYDYLGSALCHGEHPQQKWQKSRIGQYDSVHKAENWHRYGFEWASDRARLFHINTYRVSHLLVDLGWVALVFERSTV